MPTLRLLEGDRVPPPPLWSWRACFPLLAAESRKNAAEVPRRPCTLWLKAPEMAIGWIGKTGSPDCVNSPQGVPLQVSCVCPTLKISGKLKLGVVIRGSAAVYDGIL